ncbi:MAG: helix-turn-helix domain-containing protein [Gammaproteobacteria bacterium]
MPRRVGLRALTRAERRVLRQKVKDLSLSARIHQRYRLIDELQQGHAPLAVADRVGCHFTVVYDWIRRFNASGFTTFEQVPNPKGRPAILRAEQLRALVEVALSSPAERGLPYTTWSVPKLTAYCRARGLLPPVTDEWVRRLLHREGLTPQRIRTWKTSHDPAFDLKKTASAPSIGPAPRARRWSASTSGGRSK